MNARPGLLERLLALPPGALVPVGWLVEQLTAGPPTSEGEAFGNDTTSLMPIFGGVAGRNRRLGRRRACVFLVTFLRCGAVFLCFSLGGRRVDNGNHRECQCGR